MEENESSSLVSVMTTEAGDDLGFNMTYCHTMERDELDRNNFTLSCAEAFAVNPLATWFMVVIQIFYALICILGLCGNTLVIYVVLRYSKMQTVTNLYILNLALADECFLVGIPFLVVTSAHGDWIFGMTMCKIYLTTTSINQFTSSIFLTVMSADRYVAVCHPISSPKFRTMVIARVVSLTAWATSALLMVPVFMYAATITKPDGGQNCNIFWPFDDSEGEDGEVGLLSGNGTGVIDDSSFDPPRHVLNGQTAFTVYSFVLGFALPLALILIFYILVIVKLKTVGPKNKSKERRKSHRKVTRLVLTVITVYILCWLPYWITQLALIFTPPGRTQDDIMVAVMLLAGCLSYSNSAMNPVLYAFLSENFKKSFMKACTCATGRDANAALQVENSMLPRRRTLLGGHGFGGHGNANKHHQDKNKNGGLHGDKNKNGDRMLLADNGGVRGNAGISDAGTTSGQVGQIELNDHSTGVTTMTSRTSNAFEVSSSVDVAANGGRSEAEVSVAPPPSEKTTTTFNGSLAPPHVV